jgi:hypothetical protein
MLTRFLMDRANALAKPAPTNAKGKKPLPKKRAPRAAE